MLTQPWCRNFFLDPFYRLFFEQPYVQTYINTYLNIYTSTSIQKFPPEDSGRRGTGKPCCDVTTVKSASTLAFWLHFTILTFPRPFTPGLLKPLPSRSFLGIPEIPVLDILTPKARNNRAHSRIRAWSHHD